jgi:hypothetical protein
MRVSLRFILLLVLSIALRGFAGPVHALPVTPHEPVQLSDCAEHESVPSAAHASHQSTDKACQISCDLSVSPVLPVVIASGVHAAPAVLSASLLVLILRDAMPPDHPPPIL